MVTQLKLRKIGNSVGVVLPKEILAYLNSKEGDTLVLTETPEAGFRLTPDKGDFARQMKIAENLAHRYRNALRELAK
jgi:putative addiction module antidote